MEVVATFAKGTTDPLANDDRQSRPLGAADLVSTFRTTLFIVLIDSDNPEVIMNCILSRSSFRCIYSYQQGQDGNFEILRSWSEGQTTQVVSTLALADL